MRINTVEAARLFDSEFVEINETLINAWTNFNCTYTSLLVEGKTGTTNALLEMMNITANIRNRLCHTLNPKHPCLRELVKELMGRIDRQDELLCKLLVCKRENLQEVISREVL